MQIKNNSTVVSADGKDVGRIDRVVLNPQTQEVTHVVVRKGFLFTEDKVVPIDRVASATDDGVTLRVTADQLADLPPFEDTHYVPLDEAELRGEPGRFAPPYALPLYWYPPPAGAGSLLVPYEFGQAGQSYTAEKERNIPDETVALKEGAAVIDADGDKVGQVEQVLTGAQSDRATGFVISRGLLLKEKKRVPMNWVSWVGENEVRLAVGARLLERLEPHKN